MKIKPFSVINAKEVSALIYENLWKVNINDYTKEELQQVEEEFTPSKLAEKTSTREMYLAWYGNEIVGTAGFHKDAFDVSIPSHYVLGVFVKVKYHRHGIGKRLIEHIESQTRERNIRMLIVPSSVTSKKFYMNLGYFPQGDKDGFNDKNKTFTLCKQI